MVPAGHGYGRRSNKIKQRGLKRKKKRASQKKKRRRLAEFHTNIVWAVKMQKLVLSLKKKSQKPINNIYAVYMLSN